MNSKVKLLIVDDHDIFRQGVKMLLNNDSAVEVIGEACNGKEFLDVVEKLAPDVVLMDIAMPVMDGIEASKLAHEKFPNLKILALTMFGDEKYYYPMIQAGIKGFILKSSGISELQNAINMISQGFNYFSNELLCKLIKNVSEKNSTPDEKNDKLTKRELEILKEIACGLSNDDIAQKLHISLSTVKTHRNSLLQKTGTNNTASLIMHAIKNKLLVVEE
jgi:DNA-binding NarL/FixJ family response regulator